MYLVIGMIFLSVSVFIAVYYVFNILVSLKIAKKTYSVKSSGGGYFFLENIFKISDALSVYFFKIKIKYVDDYVKKTNFLLDFGYEKTAEVEQIIYKNGDEILEKGYHDRVTDKVSLSDESIKELKEKKDITIIDI